MFNNSTEKSKFYIFLKNKDPVSLKLLKTFSSDKNFSKLRITFVPVLALGVCDFSKVTFSDNAFWS